jgi:hypothetical protein
MIRNIGCFSTWGGLLLVAVVVTAADSGPAAGTPLPPLRAYAVTGDVQNQEVNFVERRQGKPTLYCFVPADQWSRPTARLLKELDNRLGTISDAALVAVWVTADPVASKDYLPRAQQSLQLGRTALAVSEEGSSGPAEWGINTEVDLTIVAAREGRVLKSFALQSPNDTLAEEVLAALK